LLPRDETRQHAMSAIIGKLNAADRMDVVLRLRSEPWLLSPADPRPVREI
jgi:hypothetical protein